MKKFIVYFAFGAITLTSLVGCEDLENLCGITQNDLGTGTVFVNSLNSMIDIYQRIDQAAKDVQLQTTGSAVIDGAQCEVIGDSLIIDFGLSDVLCSDNKTRKGSIRAKLTGDYLQPNGQIAAKLSGYHVNNVLQSGSFLAINNGPAAAPEIDISAQNFDVENESSVNYALDAIWLAGFTTPEITDDVFDVSGTLGGDDLQNTKTYTSEILTPLHYVNACPHFVEYGVADVTLVGDTAVSGFGVDFVQSDGCNNIFQVTLDCNGSPVIFDYAYN